jgi:outer membrane protein
MTKRTIPLLILVLLTVLGTSPLAPAQDKLSLKQCVDLVLAQSDQIKMAAESVTGAELKIAESKSLYWPAASLSGNYLRSSFFGSFDFPMNGQTYKIQFGLANSYRAALAVNGVIFNWGRTARTVDLSRAGLTLAQDGVNMAKQMLGYQVVPFFYGTVFFREAIQVLEDNRKAFEKKLEIMTERYKAGLASDFETNLLRVQIGSLEAQKLDFENNIAKFRIAFNALSGRPEEATFAPDTSLVFRAADYNRDDLLKEAFANRIEFQQVDHQVSLNQVSLGLAKTGNKPTVAAAFNYEFRNGFMPIVEEIHGNWTVALTINYPAFDGFRTKAQIAEAQSTLKQTELRRGDVERTVTIEIESALSDLRTIEKKLEIEKLKIKQAEDALRIAEERFQNGLLSATDLVDAQNAVESARLNALQLVYSHVVGEYALFRACGRKL